jgi:hypothetical protein
MDLAKRKGGDGQVAGLPEEADAERFYRGLATTLGEEK